MDILKSVPVINSVEELQNYINPLYVIEKYLVSEEVYEDFKKRIRNIVRGAFRKRECYTYKVKIKFYEDDTEIHEMELRHLLPNVYIWEPFIEINDIKILDESFILRAEDVPNINDFLYEKIISPLWSHSIPDNVINRWAGHITDDLRTIGVDFSSLIGLHYDEDTFLDMYEDPEYREMMDLTFEGTSYQPAEMEDILNRVEKNLKNKLKNDRKNPIGQMIRAGTGPKMKQLIEFIVMISMRPSLEGDVIPIPINNAYLINGLDRPSYMYLDALGARKPLIANNKEMGPVGYFGKTLNIAARTLEVSTDNPDCGSRHLVRYNVKTKKHLEKLVTKYRYDPDIDDFVVVSPEDTHLIGKQIQVRSAVTCCCGENEVCATCIGSMMRYNWDIAKGFSVFLTEEYSKDVEQNVLSTKHLLVTRSERIEFSDTFYNYFNLEGEEIKLLRDIKSTKELVIFINPEEIKKVEELDNNSTYNNYIETGRFYIINRKTLEEFPVSIKGEKKIYIRTEASDIMESNEGIIPLKDVDGETPLFEISIENSELTKPFYDLMSLLDSEAGREGAEESVDELCQRFLDISVEAGFNVPVSAGELILNRLCRKPDNIRKRPNFGKKKLPRYRFFSVSKVVENNGSPTLGLIFEQLKRQITNISDMDDRKDPSYIDPMFKEVVSMEPWYRHKAIIDAEEYE